jgi:hypothetical protein
LGASAQQIFSDVGSDDDTVGLESEGFGEAEEMLEMSEEFDE